MLNSGSSWQLAPVQKRAPRQISQKAPRLGWRRKPRGVTVSSSRYAGVQTQFPPTPFLVETCLSGGLGSQVGSEPPQCQRVKSLGEILEFYGNLHSLGVRRSDFVNSVKSGGSLLSILKQKCPTLPHRDSEHPETEGRGFPRQWRPFLHPDLASGRGPISPYSQSEPQSLIRGPHTAFQLGRD